MSVAPQIQALLALDLAEPRNQASDYQAPRQTAGDLIRVLEAQPSQERTVDATVFQQVLSKVQTLAFVNSDREFDAHLADWTERNWTQILQHDSDDIESRLGLGRSWLLKAQPSLARIEAQDAGSSSTRSSGSSGLSQREQPGQTSRLRASTRRREDNDRIDSADYVQARDMLRASIEHFDKALAAAYRHDALTGDVLESAAEAYLHTGNVSHPRTNERFYQRALHLLKVASEIDDHEMDASLGEFLESNESYVADIGEPWYTV